MQNYEFFGRKLRIEFANGGRRTREESRDK